ncbi:MAG: hypothetical protein ACHQF3_06650 [Alphaproteobacteria bacterium]
MRRITIYLLSFAVVLVMTPQRIPHAPAMPSDSTMSMAGMDMSNCDHQTAPAKGLTPACADGMCCVTIIGLPTPPLTAPASFKWGVLSYNVFDVALSGRTIRPEIPPPILRA